MSSDDDVDVYVVEVEGGPHSSAVVSTTPIRAGDLTDDHIGKMLGFHDDRSQRNVRGEILRVEHHDGPPQSVSVWFRYQAPAGRLGLTTTDDYMNLAPFVMLQIVEMLPC